MLSYRLSIFVLCRLYDTRLPRIVTANCYTNSSSFILIRGPFQYLNGFVEKPIFAKIKL